MKKVLIIADVHPYLINKLHEKGYESLFVESSTENNFFSVLSEAEGIITSNKLPITKDIIDKAPHLKWIGRMGSGMEIIDVNYAHSKSIECFSSPEGNANAVAEQALGMLLALQHRILKSHLELRNHLWLREENRGIEIEGKTAGIIGYGNNGSALATKLSNLGVHVLVFDKYKTGFSSQNIIECKSLNPIYEQADFISFHVPLNEETKHYFDFEFMEQMKKDFVLLNLSRGPVVSLQALSEGMRIQKITAAALDVWEKEPYWLLPEEEERLAEQLMAQPNFIGTPHIGGYTVDALYKMSYQLVKKICQYDKI